MQQTDVKSAHQAVTGFLLPVARTRVKQITYSGNGSQAGALMLFDTTVAPVTASYAKTANVVTVTSTAHGLANGAIVGIGYLSATGNSATDGNYAISNALANTFAITDINLVSNVSGGTGCYYVANGSRWVTSFDTLTSQTSTQQISIPGEGVLVTNGLYAQMTSIGFVTVFYG
jgi:uncharacterized membrane protein